MSSDYYTAEKRAQLWPLDWYEGMFQESDWMKGEIMQPINPTYDNYFPYGCDVCKRGPSLTHTPLFYCSRCRIVKYCCREHQKHAFQDHKHWCQAVGELRKEMDNMNASSRQDWEDKRQETFRRIRYKTDMQLHSSNLQKIIMQPRCRKCYKAGADPKVTLICCSRCGGTALCSSCCVSNVGSEATNHLQFHPDVEDPTLECDTYRLAAACIAMIVEEGHPLGMPSDTDSPDYWAPVDWIEYFARKETDFESNVPSTLLQGLPPAKCFLADAHSTMLTIQHVLSLVPQVHEIEAGSLSRLTIHMVGAGAFETDTVCRYVEMTRLNPSLQELEIVMVGTEPDIADPPTPYSSQLALENIRPDCKITITAHVGLYHELMAKLPEPTIIICCHAGMHDCHYTDTWRLTVERIAKRGTLMIVTGWDHMEVVKDLDLMLQWGPNLQVVVPPTPNPFRGLWPFMDPARETGDFVKSNASFVVVRGK